VFSCSTRTAVSWPCPLVRWEICPDIPAQSSETRVVRVQNQFRTRIYQVFMDICYRWVGTIWRGN